MRSSTPRKSATAQVFIEIESGALRIQRDDAVETVLLQRGPDGLLTPECVAERTAQLRGLMGQPGGSRRVKAWCALGARGVSLRRFSLPAHVRENPRQLLTLQIESDFPLAPEDLAWGYVALPTGQSSNSTGGATRDYLVAAVKRNIVEQYQRIFMEAGLEVTFTLSAALMGSLVPSGHDQCAVLRVGPRESEWTILEEGFPLSTRTIPWGEENLVEVLVAEMGVDKDQANHWLEHGSTEDTQNGKHDRLIEEAAGKALVPILSAAINGNSGWQIFLASRKSILPGVIQSLTQNLPTERPCQPWPGAASAKGTSPALGALQGIAESGTRALPVILSWTEAKQGATGAATPGLMKWVAFLVVLALGLISLRYVEPLVRRDHLQQRMEAMQTAWEERPEIDHELDFLQYLQTNQPPFLEVLSIMAEAAGQGTKLDSLSMNRRGEMSLKGVMPDSKVAGEFRSKLIKSGWFSSLVLEEQSPVPNQKKVNVRLSGRWRMSPVSQAASPAEDASTPEDPSGSEPETEEAD